MMVIMMMMIMMMTVAALWTSMTRRRAPVGAAVCPARTMGGTLRTPGTGPHPA